MGFLFTKHYPIRTNLLNLRLGARLYNGHHSPTEVIEDVASDGKRLFVYFVSGDNGSFAVLARRVKKGKAYGRD